MDCNAFYREFIANIFPEDRSFDLEDWGGDIPWTVIFSSLGKYFVKDFATLSEEKRQKIFLLIKLAMEKEGDLSTAVATGLLEELHKASTKKNALAYEIINRLDTESSLYIMAWKEWSELR
ncbi:MULTISPECIES: hypothetical protein [Xanthomonas]|uniref:hypothetical protein n=1 Tax=Xanthomonas TaxID=338 RepID=UPI0012907083|nr:MULTISPECIES: hypothetical protein [Xanthomonas]